jgi:hypothetical protein
MDVNSVISKLKVVFPNQDFESLVHQDSQYFNQKWRTPLPEARQRVLKAWGEIYWDDVEWRLESRLTKPGIKNISIYRTRVVSEIEKSIKSENIRKYLTQADTVTVSNTAEDASHANGRQSIKGSPLTKTELIVEGDTKDVEASKKVHLDKNGDNPANKIPTPPKIIDPVTVEFGREKYTINEPQRLVLKYLIKKTKAGRPVTKKEIINKCLKPKGHLFTVFYEVFRKNRPAYKAMIQEINRSRSIRIRKA